MAEVFHFELLGNGIGTLTFDSPGRPVNVFDRRALDELEQRIDELGRRDDLPCLVLLSGKEGNFIAGADVDEIAGVSDPLEAEAASRLGHRLFAAWEALPFPTIAAIRGSCFGGGTELSLASDHILVSDGDSARIALPEVKLGIVPAWGGCTRLPRRVGLSAALEVILTGKTIYPRKALRMGLADALIPEASFGHLVRDYAARVADGSQPSRRESGGLKELLLERNPVGRKLIFDQARKKTLESTHGNYPAPLRALEIVRVGIDDGPEAGFDAEARAVAELAIGRVSKNLLHVFHLTEDVKKRLPAPSEAAIEGVAVVGAGVMGGGIAQLVAEESGLPVRMKDLDAKALGLGMEHAARLFEKLVEKHRLSRPRALEKMALLRPTLDYSGFERCDLVVEAIVERLDVKRKVFAELADAVGSGAILASNTSSLSIDEIAGDVAAPERVIGMHFFNPVHKMPLVEVVRGRRTGDEAVRRVAAFARRLGKTPVVVTDAPGFLVNRLLMFSLGEALSLLEDGVPIATLDRVMKAWGMPMGPIELTDEVGLDVAVHVAGVVGDAFPDRLRIPEWLGRMVEDGRLGTKAGKGFYRYKGRRRQDPDPEVYPLLGLTPRDGAGEDGIVERVSLPMVNEAARCLAEGITSSAANVDLAMILGTGFPPFRGGLCRWADETGLERVLETLERLAEEVGPRFAPSDALRSVAEKDGFYAAYPAAAG
ncbi:MAG: 3-hydroxyacyl-CoA dehydrogenase NAD-binding domain-containing protein [Thermoanaerobaculia bacterium]